MTELDRILLHAAAPEPSAGFTAKVMRAARRTAGVPGPLAFPWAVVGLGLLAAFGLVPLLATVAGGLLADGAVSVSLGGKAGWLLGTLILTALAAYLPIELLGD